MIYDYAAFQKKRIDSSQQHLEQAVRICPHTAYLGFKAIKDNKTDEIRNIWKTSIQTSEDWAQKLKLIPDHSGFDSLPPFSFMLQFRFQLRKPYLSADDEMFYIIDNPVRKEKVFRMPMVASTGWKGALRYAFWQLGFTENDPVIKRLFGNPRTCDEQNKFQAGRLRFYSSFFDRVDFDIINPHDRETGKTTEKGPILHEVVPAEKSTAIFTLTYVPLFAGSDIRQEVRKDLKALANGLPAMMTTYGFGAKTSSGFGVTQNNLEIIHELDNNKKKGELSLLLAYPKNRQAVGFDSLSNIGKAVEQLDSIFEGEHI